MPAEDRERIERLFAYEALLDVDSVETDYRVVGLDGVMRIVRDRADVRDRDAERVVFDGSLVDVTAERRLIDDMGAVERRLEAAAAVAGLALWQVEFDVDGPVLRSDIVPGLEVLLGGRSRPRTCRARTPSASTRRPRGVRRARAGPGGRGSGRRSSTASEASTAGPGGSGPARPRSEAGAGRRVTVCPPT
jgi:hypothetical protein